MAAKPGPGRVRTGTTGRWCSIRPEMIPLVEEKARAGFLEHDMGIAIGVSHATFGRYKERGQDEATRIEAAEAAFDELELKIGNGELDEKDPEVRANLKAAKKAIAPIPMESLFLDFWRAYQRGRSALRDDCLTGVKVGALKGDSQAALRLLSIHDRRYSYAPDTQINVSASAAASSDGDAVAVARSSMLFEDDFHEAANELARKHMARKTAARAAEAAAAGDAPDDSPSLLGGDDPNE